MGRRFGIGLLVFVLIVGVLLVAADRIGASAAESMIADQAAKEMQARNISSPQRPDVSVGGFPFLTQVLAGRYDKVTIKVDQPQTDKVKLEKLTLVAAPVHAPLKALTSHQGQVTADVVTGTATMSWKEVTKLLEVAGAPGVDPSSVQVNVVDDKLKLRIPLVAAGTRVTVTADGNIQVADGKVRVKLTNVGTEGAKLPPLVTAVVNSAAQNVVLTVKIPAMPYKLTIKKVETNPDGIVATASADNVRLAG